MYESRHAQVRSIAKISVMLKCRTLVLYRDTDQYQYCENVEKNDTSSHLQPSETIWSVALPIQQPVSRACINASDYNRVRCPLIERTNEGALDGVRIMCSYI